MREIFDTLRSVSKCVGAGPLTAREETCRRAFDGCTRKGRRTAVFGIRSFTRRCGKRAVPGDERKPVSRPRKAQVKPRKWQLNGAFREIIIKYGIA